MARLPKMDTNAVRTHEWAGRFYPGNPSALRLVVQEMLKMASASIEAPEPNFSGYEQATSSNPKELISNAQMEHQTELPSNTQPKNAAQINPKAIISPHAGYIYSGPIAGKAFAPFQRQADQIRRIVLLGPSHYVPFSGLAICSFSAYSTPLGEVPLDSTALSMLSSFKQISVRNDAHEHEHSLEVQLPFLQCILRDFHLVPIVVGNASEETVAAVIEALWGGDETRIVISSDLSHFLDYDSAYRMDKATAAAIQNLRAEDILDENACGRFPVKGMLFAARKAGLQCRLLDLRNSGDTSGAKNRVVGYGAFAFY